MSDPGLGQLPDLVPARMVNAFAYCPRLFHLEWVQSRFETNADVEAGRYVHRAVDVESGAAPLPEMGDLRSARSVMLSSDRLGLIARLDILEGVGGAVRPVDVKRGAKPSGEVWLSDRVQLCVQGIILRENGYRCDGGVVYYAASRQRVELAFDDDLVAETLECILRLREVAVQEVAPPPLVDSPKCPRCSLVGICLPDELNALSARSEGTPRRLVPRDSEARPLYVTEQGAMVGVDQGRLRVSVKGEVRHEQRLIDLSQLNVYGNVQVSSQLLRQLFAREVPVCWFSYGGWFAGVAHGLPSKYVDLRRRQVSFAHRGNVEIARRMVYGKVRNCRTLLRRNTRAAQARVLSSLKELADQALEATRIASLLGIEGTAARLYFGAFPSMLRPELSMPGAAFSFEGRQRRPPPDAVNCLLGYVYALLVKDLTATTLAVGFDPYIGFYHRPRFGRPALALDLAEEFRPLIGDSVVLNAINNGEVKPSHFLSRAGGVSLTADGRRAVIQSYERRMDTSVTHPVFGYRVTYRRVLEVQARLLAAHLVGEVEDYTSFMTR